MIFGIMLVLMSLAILTALQRKMLLAGMINLLKFFDFLE
jgi:hypothetical protein